MDITGGPSLYSMFTLMSGLAGPRPCQKKIRAGIVGAVGGVASEGRVKRACHEKQLGLNIVSGPGQPMPRQALLVERSSDKE
jgi:hypothetical protein